MRNSGPLWQRCRALRGCILLHGPLQYSNGLGIQLALAPSVPYSGVQIACWCTRGRIPMVSVHLPAHLLDCATFSPLVVYVAGRVRDIAACSACALHSPMHRSRTCQNSKLCCPPCIPCIRRRNTLAFSACAAYQSARLACLLMYAMRTHGAYHRYLLQAFAPHCFSTQR